METPKKDRFSFPILHLKSVLNAIIDLIYPPLCLICDLRLKKNQQEICLDCLNRFVLLGKPHAQFSVPGEIFIHKAWALFDFDESFQTLIHHLKYSRRRKAVIAVLNHYSAEILNQLPTDSIDLVISIPLHPRKLRERGYNQVDDVSKWLARKLDTRSGSKVVQRQKYTTSQTTLNAEERFENVRDAFRIKDKTLVHNKHILLVDDVLTTGATANALAQVLCESGAAEIDLLTLSTPQYGNA